MPCNMCVLSAPRDGERFSAVDAIPLGRRHDQGIVFIDDGVQRRNLTTEWTFYPLNLVGHQVSLPTAVSSFLCSGEEGRSFAALGRFQWQCQASSRSATVQNTAAHPAPVRLAPTQTSR